jgi:hypothetical protein
MERELTPFTIRGRAGDEGVIYSLSLVFMTHIILYRRINP